MARYKKKDAGQIKNKNRKQFANTMTGLKPKTQKPVRDCESCKYGIRDEQWGEWKCKVTQARVYRFDTVCSDYIPNLPESRIKRGSNG